jgi:hypothetical protein
LLSLWLFLLSLSVSLGELLFYFFGDEGRLSFCFNYLLLSRGDWCGDDGFCLFCDLLIYGLFLGFS